MALELSDLNDATILQQTKQLAGPNNSIQFSINLGPGRGIESEWIAEDKKREALFKWIDVVKNTVIAHAEEDRAKQRRAALEKAAETAQVAPEAVLAKPPASPDNTDPTLYARDRLLLATEEVKYWSERRDEALVKEANARDVMERWTKIVEALEDR